MNYIGAYLQIDLLMIVNRSIETLIITYFCNTSKAVFPEKTRTLKDDRLESLHGGKVSA